MLNPSTWWSQVQDNLSLSTQRIKTYAIIGLGIIIVSTLGFAVPELGIMALAVPVLPVGGLVLFFNPFLGFLIMVATLPVEALALFSDGLTITKLLGIGVFGIWLSGKMLRHETFQNLFTPDLTKIVLCLLVLVFASGLWAIDSSRHLPKMFTVINLLLWFFLVVDLVSTWDRLVWVVKTLVVLASVTGILTITQYYQGLAAVAGTEAEGSFRAGGGISGGINSTAYILVTTVPLAVYLMRSNDKWPWRFLGSVYIGLAFIGVAVTFSRTSLMFLITILAIQFWSISKEVSKAKLLLGLGTLILVAMFIIPRDLILERIQSIGPYLQTSLTGEVNEEGYIDGRGFIYRVGWVIFQDYPILGVGFENFGDAFFEYQYYVPGAREYVNCTCRSPHSTYLGMLTELGLPGLVIWVSLMWASLYNLMKAWSILSKTKLSQQFLLVQAVTYGITLQIVYGFVRTLFDDKLFWLFLGMSIAVRVLAEQENRLHSTPHMNDKTAVSSFPALIKS